MDSYKTMDRIFKNNFIELMNSEEGIIDEIKAAGSTDFGDLSQIIPCLHLWVGGVTGNLHTKDYEISDEELAYIIPAKAMAMTVIDLLFDNAKLANEVIKNFNPKLSKESYLKFMEENTRIYEYDYID